MLLPFLFIVFVIIPVILWLWFFRREDAGEPEPRSFLFKIFLLGIMAAILAVMLEFLAAQVFFPGKIDQLTSISLEKPESFSLILLLAMAVFSVIEESVKFFFLRIYTYFSPNFTQISDGALYGVTLALSFALLENAVYFFEFNSEKFELIDLIILIMVRCIAPLLMHLVSTGIAGLYMGRKKFSQSHSSSIMVKGFLIAASIHVFYNGFLLLPKYGIFISFTIIIFALIYLLREISKPESKMVWKLVDK